MPTEITPVAGYPAYPIQNVPIDGEDHLAGPVNDIYQDVYNRVVYLKDLVDTAGTNITALGVEDTALQVLIDALTVTVATLNTYITNINTNEGGNVKNGSPDAYSVVWHFTSGDSRKTALEKLSTALHTAELNLAGLITPVATHTVNISSLANKIGANALDSISGLGISNLYLLITDKLDSIVTKLSDAILTNRRINNTNLIQNILNWQAIKSGAGYFYDSLIDSAKTNAASTVNAYSQVKQQFGIDNDTWFYYNNVAAVPAGTNYVMYRIIGDGTFTVYANLAGSYTSGWVALPNQDAWVAVSTGQQLVLKVSGTSTSKMYTTMALYKTG